VPLPPEFEQKAIVESVSEKTEKLMALRNSAIRGIRLLEERRAALIVSAVTGQMGVRVSPSKSLIEDDNAIQTSLVE
jgi:type I restriction enzyme, S subunit